LQDGDEHNVSLDAHVGSIPAKWHQKILNPSYVTDDRQTDHTTENCLGVSGIACAAKAIAPKNELTHIAKLIVKCSIRPVTRHLPVIMTTSRLTSSRPQRLYLHYTYKVQ